MTDSVHERRGDRAVSAADALSRYLEATNSHDFDNVGRLLTPDAVYFLGNATCVGVAAVREYFERTWTAIPDEHYGAESVEWVASADRAAVRHIHVPLARHLPRSGRVGLRSRHQRLRPGRRRLVSEPRAPQRHAGRRLRDR